MKVYAKTGQYHTICRDVYCMGVVVLHILIQSPDLLVTTTLTQGRVTMEGVLLFLDKVLFLWWNEIFKYVHKGPFSREYYRCFQFVIRKEKLWFLMASKFLPPNNTLETADSSISLGDLGTSSIYFISNFHKILVIILIQRKSLVARVVVIILIQISYLVDLKGKDDL